MYVIWHDDVLGNGQILYRKSTNAGSIFGSTINISNNPEEWWSWISSIAAIGNNVYIVWGTDTQGNAEIFFRISRNGGSTFESAINISNDETISADPSISVSKPP